MDVVFSCLSHPTDLEADEKSQPNTLTQSHFPLPGYYPKGSLEAIYSFPDLVGSPVRKST